MILLRADNQGEGGTLSLLALAQRAWAARARLLLGVLGAALFYGDALITPAISVLSAVEGLKLVTPSLNLSSSPSRSAIIIGLFPSKAAAPPRWRAVRPDHVGLVRRAWPSAALSTSWPIPAVLAALNPVHAIISWLSNGRIGLIALGAVFLAVTGAEALYADLGHFGRGPIQFAWIASPFRRWR